MIQATITRLITAHIIPAVATTATIITADTDTGMTCI